MGDCRAIGSLQVAPVIPWDGDNRHDGLMSCNFDKATEQTMGDCRAIGSLQVAPVRSCEWNIDSSMKAVRIVLHPADSEGC
jgi:hypothetical protein